ncbi:MAG: tetratricopeptide repeat protein [Nitrospinae bacterium]|nr:tetratricopeptide repeat protein [Nitrospinota bacterium]
MQNGRNEHLRASAACGRRPGVPAQKKLPEGGRVFYAGAENDGRQIHQCPYRPCGPLPRNDGNRKGSGGTQEDLFHTLNRVAISLRKQKKYDDAIRNYRKALKIYPDDAVVHYNMGMVYTLKQESHEAVDCFKKALRLNPNFAEVKTEMEKLRKTQGKLISCFTNNPFSSAACETS